MAIYGGHSESGWENVSHLLEPSPVKLILIHQSSPKKLPFGRLHHAKLGGNLTIYERNFPKTSQCHYVHQVGDAYENLQTWTQADRYRHILGEPKP